MWYVGPCHAGSSLISNRLCAMSAGREVPQPDSSAACAIVKLAGIFVSAIEARAAGATMAMKAAGVTLTPRRAKTAHRRADKFAPGTSGDRRGGCHGPL